MNGPVDNPNSGCLGCHGTAQYPLAPMLPGNACNTDAERLQWFRNFTGDVPFGRVDASCVLDPDPTGLVALDFSLQMKVVLQSVLDFHDVNPCAADPEIEAAAGLPEAVVLPQAENSSSWRGGAGPSLSNCRAGPDRMLQGAGARRLTDF